MREPQEDFRLEEQKASSPSSPSVCRNKGGVHMQRVGVVRAYTKSTPGSLKSDVTECSLIPEWDGWWSVNSPQESLSPKRSEGDMISDPYARSELGNGKPLRSKHGFFVGAEDRQPDSTKSQQLRNPLEVARALETLQLPRSHAVDGEEGTASCPWKPFPDPDGSLRNDPSSSSCGLGSSRAIAHDASPPDHRKVDKKRQAIGHGSPLVRMPVEGADCLTPVARARRPA